jgi:hypothetical protein
MKLPAKTKLSKNLNNDSKSQTEISKNFELDLSSGSKIKLNKPNKDVNNTNSGQKQTLRNYDMPLSRNKVNLCNNISLTKKPVKQWKGDQLLLDDLDKIYKKLPDMDRLELLIDFSDDFKAILNI